MSYEDIIQDPYRALAYCLGVVQILQNHNLTWCKSALSEGDAALAAYYLDLLESCIKLLEKTMADTLKKVAKGAVP